MKMKFCCQMMNFVFNAFFFCVYRCLCLSANEPMHGGEEEEEEEADKDDEEEERQKKNVN